MAKVEHSSDARVLVGIDISKHRHDVLIAAPGKARRRRMTVLNSAEECRRLSDFLRDFGRPIRVGVEGTGNDHRALMFALGSAGFELKLNSFIALARMRQALHPSEGTLGGQVTLAFRNAGCGPAAFGWCDLEHQESGTIAGPSL